MELTQEHFDDIVKGLATKKDLEGFATRKDLEGFATKEDLVNLATKDDLLAFPTRQDFTSLKSSVDEIKEIVMRLDKRTDEDHRAAIKDIEKLQKRVKVIEQKLDLQTQ